MKREEWKRPRVSIADVLVYLVAFILIAITAGAAVWIGDTLSKMGQGL